MNIIFIISCVAAVLLNLFFAISVAKISAETLDSYRKLCRNQRIGVMLGFPLLCWCVPHTQAIIFSWAEPYLWYAAIVLAVLSYFYLDYLFARALGGLFIIGAYCLVNWGYEFQAAGAIFLSIVSWLWGIIGIFISGKPSYLRDYFTKCAEDKKLKNISYAFFAASAVIFMISAIGELLK